MKRLIVILIFLCILINMAIAINDETPQQWKISEGIMSTLPDKMINVLAHKILNRGEYITTSDYLSVKNSVSKKFANYLWINNKTIKYHIFLVIQDSDGNEKEYSWLVTCKLLDWETKVYLANIPVSGDDSFYKIVSIKQAKQSSSWGWSKLGISGYIER
jgi:hypothetical protein